jgi:CBS domain-containing protein
MFPMGKNVLKIGCKDNLDEEGTVKSLVELSVKNIYDHKLKNSMVINALDPLDKIAQIFYRRSNLRGVFLVTPEKRLYGVVTRHDLLNFLKNHPISNITQSIAEIATILRNTQAKDVVHKFSYAASITPDTSISQALETMIRLDLIDIPVVDKRRRIIGEITLTTILNKLLQVYRKEKG